MSCQDLVLDAIQEPSGFPLNTLRRVHAGNPDETINMILFLLDRRDVVAAINRLRAGHGLRVVK